RGIEQDIGFRRKFIITLPENQLERCIWQRVESKSRAAGIERRGAQAFGGRHKSGGRVAEGFLQRIDRTLDKGLEIKSGAWNVAIGDPGVAQQRATALQIM